MEMEMVMVMATLHVIVPIAGWIGIADVLKTRIAFTIR